MTIVNEIDQATRELYERVRASAQHGPFIREVEDAHSLAPLDHKPRVVVMPGAFHREYAHTGADGRRVLENAAELGWPAEVVDVPSLESMAQNAELLVKHLAGSGNEPIVLVSLSKGSADVRAALARPDADMVFQNVRAWVSLSGIITGTPLIAWLKARPLRCLGVRLLLRVRHQRFADVDEMRHGPGSPLAKPLQFPPSMRVIHVVGFPLQRDLSNNWARRGHARLAALGPNDGGGILLRDIVELPGVTYPVWGADHYLNPSWNIRPLLMTILQAAARPTGAMVAAVAH